MTTRSVPAALVLLILLPWMVSAQTDQPLRQLRVFLDCEDCFSDYLRQELDFVAHVRDREEADVHVIITDIETASGGREYTAAFMGEGALAALDRTLKTVTANADSDDTVRRQIAIML